MLTDAILTKSSIKISALRSIKYSNIWLFEDITMMISEENSNLRIVVGLKVVTLWLLDYVCNRTDRVTHVACIINIKIYTKNSNE